MNYAHTDDAELVALTLSGDQSAYEQLVIRHQSAAIAAAARVIGSPSLAEDAAQDAFVTAWMKLNTLDQPGKFGVWICRIARNCALNMRNRIRDTLPEDTLDQLPEDQEASPEASLIRSEENRLLYESIAKLPENLAETIRLHYFYGLSVADIAKRLGLSEGGVKWRLHKGRQSLKEDLAAMNETENNTLLQRVMRKVEELKGWLFQRGMETAYEETLSEVEKLPESTDKYHMLADVYTCGYSRLPDKRSDDLYADMWEAAVKGRNIAAMKTVLNLDFLEHSWNLVETIRDKRIPQIEALELPKMLGWAWFQLGRACHRAGDHESGFAAFDRVREILTPADACYAATIATEKVERKRLEVAEKLDTRRRKFSARGTEYRAIGGELRLSRDVPYFGEGSFMQEENAIPDIWYHAAFGVNRFFFHAKEVGETYTERNWKLTYGGTGHTVNTPAGLFENCVLYSTQGLYVGTWYETYYKEGVGIVRQDAVYGGVRTVYSLSEYRIAGGSGLLPACAGNRWSYASEHNSPYYDGMSIVEIIHADGESVVASGYAHQLRYGYDPENWRDMAIAARNLYKKMGPDREWIYEDVRPYMARMKALAKTPYQIAHTRAACSVMERILSSEAGLNPDRTEEGIWNHFSSRHIVKREDRLIDRNDWLLGFMSADFESAPKAVSCCTCYGVFQDALGNRNPDELAGQINQVQHFNYLGETELIITPAGRVVTPAGSFDDCLVFSMNITGMPEGQAYNGGKKEYYLAPGVGIVKAVHHFDDEPDCAYDLCEYEGVGEGWFPLEDGFRRFYRAVGLTEGYRASAEYTVATGENGELYLLADLMGMRKI